MWFHLFIHLCIHLGCYRRCILCSDFQWYAWLIDAIRSHDPTFVHFMVYALCASAFHSIVGVKRNPCVMTKNFFRFIYYYSKWLSPRANLFEIVGCEQIRLKAEKNGSKNEICCPSEARASINIDYAVFFRALFVCYRWFLSYQAIAIQFRDSMSERGPKGKVNTLTLDGLATIFRVTRKKWMTFK